MLTKYLLKKQLIFKMQYAYNDMFLVNLSKLPMDATFFFLKSSRDCLLLLLWQTDLYL